MRATLITAVVAAVLVCGCGRNADTRQAGETGTSGPSTPVKPGEKAQSAAPAGPAARAERGSGTEGTTSAGTTSGDQPPSTGQMSK